MEVSFILQSEMTLNHLAVIQVRVVRAKVTQLLSSPFRDTDIGGVILSAPNVNSNLLNQP